MIEHLKNHNTSLPRLTGQEVVQNLAILGLGLVNISKTTTSSRRQVSDDSSPERRPSMTQSLDEYHSCHYGNRGVSSFPCASASQKQDRSRSRNFSRSPRRREREVRPGGECQVDRPSAHEDWPTDEIEMVNFGNVNPGVVNYK